MKRSIPNPCSEDWAKMSPIEKGRHCPVCDHKVVDFTHFSDKKIVAFLDAQTGKVCGRISPQQLNRNLFIPEYESRNLLKRAAAIMALLGGASIGFAQETPDTVVVQNEVLLKSEDSLKANHIDSVRFFEGVLLDENNEAVPFANVIAKDELGKIITWCASDFNGKFKLQLNDSITEFTLYISSVSFKELKTKIKINPKTNKFDNTRIFKLKNADFILREVMIANPRIEKPKIEKRKKRKNKRKNK